jgi:signal transduction histidine kinase
MGCGKLSPVTCCTVGKIYKNAPVTAFTTKPTSTGAKRVPQVVVLLDEDARVLSVSGGPAGAGFLALTEDHQLELHEQLHPHCDGECRFNNLWKTAWSSLSLKDAVEWEIDDLLLGKLLRLNLARPPTAKHVDKDRRRRYALLTITDITKHRRAYESLVKRERALLKLLRDRDIDPADSVSDDRGHRFVGRRAVLAQELERKRIAAELHDGIAQSAGVIKYHIEANIERLGRADPSLDLAPLQSVVELTRGLVDEIRRITSNLTPTMLNDFGLCVALEGLCKEYQSGDCEFRPNCESCVDEAYLPDIVKFAVYRITQEALSNVTCHAGASFVQVRVRMTDGALQLEVSDDGAGFDEAQKNTGDGRSGHGMRNMRERAVATGGDISIESAPGSGTTIRAAWPREVLDRLLSDESVVDSVDGDS